MNRSLDGLTGPTFDVLVIGGGIHGAVTAWDAALRGLSVALIERGDFGCATSQNSLKIIHGGLRYLQDGNLPRIRKMAYERTTWMKIAPHLIHPLPCLTPTQHKKITRSRLAMTFALLLNDFLSFDRNRLADPEKHLPGGKVISPQECARLLPGYDVSDSTGAAVWHDAHVLNTERLVLDLILSAAAKGAQVANYVEAVGFLKQDHQVTGVRAKDMLSGQSLEIKSKIVINCAGAWIDGLLGKAAVSSGTATSIAINVIVDQLWPGIAAGIPSHPGPNKRSQILFVVPWRDKSVIGTWHIPWNRSPDEFKINDSIVQEFLREINSANPPRKLSLQDVQHVNWGFLPVSKENAQREHVKLLRDDQVIDHQKKDGLSGLISVVSVKYTTARVTAAEVVDLAVEKASLKEAGPCQTHVIPIDGGQIEDFKDFLSKAHVDAPQGTDAEVIEHMVYTYGSQYKKLLDYANENPEWGQRLDPHFPVTAAEVIHAVRHEKAITLADVIQRRTELGAGGLPSAHILKKCAELMGSELGWSLVDQEKEIASVIQSYSYKQSEERVG